MAAWVAHARFAGITCGFFRRRGKNCAVETVWAVQDVTRSR